MTEAIDIEKILADPSSHGGVYFVGIGGIGMSALARYFNAKGVKVSGYDKTETALTTQLTKEGIAIDFTDDVSLIPKDVVLVVYTPAIPASHAGLVYYQQNGYTVAKRSEVLGAITRASFNICVAGTHGKTTISTMIAHLLRHTGYGCNAFLGGISTNYNTNFWSDKNNVCVVEADEYDRSFLKLSPDIAVISSMDADHLDIYGDENNMQDAFVAFGSRVKKDGIVLSKFGLGRIKEVEASNKKTYSLQNESADAYASDVRMEVGGYHFNVHLPGKIISGIKLNVGGMHNIENMVAAIAVANQLEIDPEAIKAAVNAYKGVKRRFEYVLPPQQKEKGGYVYPVFIDDYAHHPEELRALLKSARSLFPQRKITVVFQPHLFTRTRDFQDGFADALSIADRIILLPIYPARELPIEDVTSDIVLSKITREEKYLLEKDAMLQWFTDQAGQIDKEFGEVIITAGAGDIDKLVAPLKTIIEKA